MKLKLVFVMPLSLKFVGVIPGSAFKNKGVQMLMDAVVDYLPCPLDLPPMKGEDSDENEVEVSPDDSAKVAGLAFKLMTDPYVGKLVFYRVYQGTLRKGHPYTTLVLGKANGFLVL